MTGSHSHKILLSLLLGLLLGSLSMAQRTTLKGYIYDATDGQALPFATIGIEGTPFGSASDKDGYYHLEGIAAGYHKVEVRCVGYRTVSEYIEIEENRPIVRNFLLEPESVELKEVNVSSQKETQKEQVGISEISILPSEIEMTPAIGGMPDLIQRIQVVPGVVSRGDIGGQIYIRGGTPVQTSMLMDEAVVYNPVHSIGMFTVFDNDIIRSVDMYTGGFGAEYGGAISSVVDIATRYGNTQRFAGKLDVSTIASKLLLEGPLLRDTTMEETSISIILSAKNSHFVQAQEWFYPYIDQEMPFYFLDLYSKLTLLVGKNLRVNLYGFNNRDKVGYSTSPAEYSWTSSGFGGDLQIMPGRASMLIKMYFAGSYYRMDLAEDYYEPRYSNIDHLSFGFRFKRYLKNQTINYGLEIMNLKTDYKYYTTAITSLWQMENSTEVSGYLQYHARVGRFMIDPGVRFVHYATLSKSSLEPRLAVKISILEHLGFKVAAGLYSQNLISAISDRDIVNFFQGFISAPVELATEGNEDPSDYYLQKAQHYIAGIEADFFRKLFINLEAYYKNYPQLINFNKSKMLNEDHYPEEPTYLTRDFIVESGFAEGIDLSVIFDDQFRRFELGYSYAITKRRYDDPQLGEIEYYPQFDRRHNLNVSASYRFGRFHLWEVDARWNFGTGFPFTPSIGYYEAVQFDENAKINYLTSNGELGIIYGEYNSARLPSYHRLDGSVKKRFLLSETTEFMVEFTVTNIYDRKNVYYTNRRTNERVYQLPILPSLRLSLAF